MIVWKPPTHVHNAPQGGHTGLAALRAALPGMIQAHAQGQGPPVQLLAVPPGTGKTWASIRVAQDLAAQGWRVAYLAGYHGFWETVQAVPHFDPGLWVRWYPIHLQTGDDDPFPTTCRYAPYMHEWLRRGYDSLDLCKALCLWDGHLGHCPYRKQSRKVKGGKVVFGMHDHLVYGLGSVEFDYLIIDELPIRPFLRRVEVPLDELDPGEPGPLQELARKLQHLGLRMALQGEQILQGKPLLDEIGPYLGDVYAQVEVLGVPMPPDIQHPEQVFSARWFYIKDLVDAAEGDYDAWKMGLQDWPHRVRLYRDRLLLLARNRLAPSMPKRITILDATAKPDLYAMLLGIDPAMIQVVQPDVPRTGRIIQIAERRHHKTALLQKGTPGIHAKQVLAILREYRHAHPGERICVITYKDLVPLFAGLVGEANTLHFGALRGDNSLEGYDTLFVIGGFQPSLRAVQDLAAALLPHRLAPFATEWDQVEVEYTLTPAGLAAHQGLHPYKEISVPIDPDLRILVEQLGTAEIVQAIYRTRINQYPVRVYVLTDLPLGIPVDDLWENMGPLVGAPEGIHWQSWLRLREQLDLAYAKGERVTAQDLAAWSGAALVYVRNNRWLHTIAQAFPDRWTLAKVPNGKRGPNPYCLLPVHHASF